MQAMMPALKVPLRHTTKEDTLWSVKQNCSDLTGGKVGPDHRWVPKGWACKWRQKHWASRAQSPSLSARRDSVRKFEQWSKDLEASGVIQGRTGLGPVNLGKAWIYQSDQPTLVECREKRASGTLLIFPDSNNCRGTPPGVSRLKGKHSFYRRAGRKSHFEGLER